MRSQLTPRVFRAILNNRPYVHPQCRRQLGGLSPTCGRQCEAQTIQRRTIFGFPSLQPSSRSKNSAPAEDGMQQMKELLHALNQQSRPPHQFVLAKAFVSFMQSRTRVPGILTQNQVRLLFATFQHLLQDPREDPKISVPTNLEPRDLEDTLSVLAQAQFEPEALPLVGEFARLVFQQLCQRIGKIAQREAQPSVEVLCAYISVLSSSGLPMEALGVVELYWKCRLSAAGVRPWVDVIKGLSKYGKEPFIETVMEKMNLQGAILDQKNHETMTVLLAENNGSAMRAVYESKIAGGFKPSVPATAAAIDGAMRESMLDWALSLSTLLPQKPSTETRDVVLLLAAGRGEGADALEARLGEMEAADPEIKSTLTTSTINKLLGFAITTHKLDLVEDYAGIAKRRGLVPDAQMYMLQMDARIKKGDVRGAVSLFQRVESEDLADQLDVRIFNQLLATLCYADPSETDYDIILSVTDRLVGMEGRFVAETLGGLCLAMLYRQDLEGVSNLLRPIIDSYGPSELSQIRHGFIRYILDATQPAENSWEAYQLLNMAFPTTPVCVRTTIMTAFFKRGRSDLACLVFGHMRQKEYSDIRPTADTYALCFQGIAEAADANGLRLVHNMLKLDLEVRLTSRILNGLMLSYAACGMPGQAMDFFREILRSKEGPSEQTLSIFFRVCETFYNGVKEATKMMEKLKSLDLQVNPNVYNAYIGALGGHCELERAADALRAMESKTGDHPSSFTLGILYNAIPNQYWKDQAEEWISTTHPELWSELEKLGRKTDEEGNQTFNIDRSIEV